MIFTAEEQQEHRAAFIRECRQKAWGAACHADFIGKQLDDLTAEYAKAKAEDNQFAADIHASETALDYHTVENRDKRKEMQARRTYLSKVMEAIGANMGQGQKVMQGMLQSVESNGALAKHAEGWGLEEKTEPEA